MKEKKLQLVLQLTQNVLTWSNDKPSLSKDGWMQPIIPATDKSIFSAKSSICPVSMVQQRETSSCPLDLMHPSVSQIRWIYLNCLLRPQQCEPLPVEQGRLWLLLPLFSPDTFLFFVVLKSDRIFLLGLFPYLAPLELRLSLTMWYTCSSAVTSRIKKIVMTFIILQNGMKRCHAVGRNKHFHIGDRKVLFKCTQFTILVFDYWRENTFIVWLK